MKKYLYTLLFTVSVLLNMSDAKAANRASLPDTCDVLTLIDGRLIYCTVTGIVKNKVYYKNCTKAFGIPRGIPVDSVFMISYPDNTYTLMHPTNEPERANKGERSWAGLEDKVYINAGFAAGIRVAVMNGGLFGSEPNPAWSSRDEVPSFTAGAVYSTSIDYNANGPTSIGLAYSTQDFYGTFQNSNINENEVLTRTNTAFRILHHFKRTNTSFDYYTGIRVGLLYWTDKMPLNNAGSPYTNFWPYFPEPYHTAASFQFLYGFRYFAENIGFGIELGLGSPFLAQASLCFRFDSEWKHSDTNKVGSSGYVSFSDGIGIPRGGFSTGGSGGGIGNGYKGLGGFANQGAVYTVSGGVPLMPHFGLTGIIGYNTNSFNISQYLTGDFYTSSSDSYSFFSFMPGLFATFTYDGFSIDARACLGYMLGTSPDVLSGNNPNPYAGGTYLYDDIQPATAGSVAYDIDMGMRFSLNRSRICLIANVDYLKSDIVFNTTEYTSTTNITPNTGIYSTNPVAIHTPVQLINLTIGAAYQFGK